LPILIVEKLGHRPSQSPVVLVGHIHLINEIVAAAPASPPGTLPFGLPSLRM
jgi:hypothetical protein